MKDTRSDIITGDQSSVLSQPNIETEGGLNSEPAFHLGTSVTSTGQADAAQTM